MAPERSPRILIVDDDEKVREHLKQVLVSEGYVVSEAVDGRAALAAIRDLHPDLVLLDVVMPEMDGLEVCRILKSGRLQDFLPVVLLTSKNDLDSRVQGLKLGADDYLSKPANPQELLARIEALLRIKRLQDQISASKKQLEDQSVTDPLTGLYNARYLVHRLQDEFKRAERYSEPLSCIALNLDAAQSLIQTQGREVFNRAVTELAEILQRGIREIDVLVRSAEDRFIILLPRTHFTGSLTVASRIWRRVKQHRFDCPGGSGRLEVSMGVSFFPNKDVASADNLLEQAGSALQKAQEVGGKQICLFQHTTYFFQPDPDGT